jgi:hypothetical protein
VLTPGSDGQIDIENAFANSGSRKQGHDLSAFRGLGILDRFLTLLDFFLAMALGIILGNLS